METWTWIVLGSVVAAVAAPLLMRSLARKDPEKAEAERREQQDVIAQLTEALEAMVATLRDGGSVPTGPGTPLHDRVAQVRPRIRKHFTLSAASEFDREIGFELNRPGVLTLPAAQVASRVERALGALRNTMLR